MFDTRCSSPCAATRACEFAGLSDLPWVQPALDALGNNAALPVPFSDPSQMSDAFARLSTSTDAVTSTSVAIRAGAQSRPTTPSEPTTNPGT